MKKLARNDGNGLFMMQVSDTPDSSVTNSCEVRRDFADTKFDIFSVIPHTDEGLYDGLIFWWIEWFWSFFSLRSWDILERLGIEGAAEFYDDFAREFWSDTDGLREAFGFPAGYRLHDFILSQVEESESSFWSETIHTEELSKESLFFIVEKSYQSRTCFGLVVVNPETNFVADVFEPHDLARNTDRITDIIDEENYLTFFYMHDGADEESYHSINSMQFMRFSSFFFLVK